MRRDVFKLPVLRIKTWSFLYLRLSVPFFPFSVVAPLPGSFVPAIPHTSPVWLRVRGGRAAVPHPPRCCRLPGLAAHSPAGSGCVSRQELNGSRCRQDLGAAGRTRGNRVFFWDRLQLWRPNCDGPKVLTCGAGKENVSSYSGLFSL